MFTRARILRGVVTERQAAILLVSSAALCLGLSLATSGEEVWLYTVCNAAVPAPLILASVIDAACHRLPDPLILSAGILALLAACVYGPYCAVEALGAGALAWAGAYAIHRVSSLGRGDVKLIGALGLWLGNVKLLCAAVFLGICGAGIWAGLLILARRAGLASYMALGPWLVAGGIIVWGLSL